MEENRNEWHKLDELRIVDRDYSGFYYSHDYARRHKNLKDYSEGYCDRNGRNTSENIVEAIEMKKDADGGILYRVSGRYMPDVSHVDFVTQFGTYISEDHGEFGGGLISPDGTELGGNFKYMFDLKDKVYAISTTSHMGSAHCSVFRFDDANNYRNLYSVGGWFQYILNYSEGNDFSEDFYCHAVDVKEESAFLILTGGVRKENSDTGHEWWKEMRLLKIENEEVEEVFRLKDCSPRHIRNVIVQDGFLYVSCDKMVLKYNMQEGKFTYFTCITREDEENLLKNTKK